MRDLIKARGAAAPLAAPKGLVFEIADLLLAQSWASFQDFQMLVRLDHGSEDEEYEEVIVFPRRTNSPVLSIVWRNAGAVFVQPIPGKKRRHTSLAEALESLVPKQSIVLTNITTAGWPTIDAGESNVRDSMTPEVRL
jgi:hypothetical protein